MQTIQEENKIIYNYPTLIEPIYNGNGGTAVKDYRVVGQDNSLPYPLFYGTYNECSKWQKENCKILNNE